MAIHQQIYEHLKEVARNGALVTYGEIAPLANLNMQNPHDRNRIAEILGEISTQEAKNNRPMLSAVVVLADNRLPGQGFFKLARELGLFHGETDIEEMEFFAREIKRLQEYWQRNSD